MTDALTQLPLAPPCFFTVAGQCIAHNRDSDCCLDQLIHDCHAAMLTSAVGILQIVEILTDALTLSETPIPTKVARLFLTSDVLHNSTAPVRNASRYRSHMETSLPDIFESLQACFKLVCFSSPPQACLDSTLSLRFRFCEACSVSLDVGLWNTSNTDCET